MPNNFRHMGLIHLILPNAKIIDARRNAMACCFSNFKQLFASGQEFTYGLEDIGRYYRTYVEFMAHWDAALPGKVLRVEHEEVVDNLEANVRRILDFCGLDFEPPCVEFYKTERSIRTASSEQVRRPIFKEGIDQWRNFEPWLGPLQGSPGTIGFVEYSSNNLGTPMPRFFRASSLSKIMAQWQHRASGSRMPLRLPRPIAPSSRVWRTRPSC